MGVIAVAARKLFDAGVTGDALFEAIAELEEAQKPVRSKAADRMVRYRQRQKEASRVTDSVTVTSRVTSLPDKKELPTPLEKTNPLSSLRSDSHTQRAREDDAIEIEFSQKFWPLYPHHVGKKPAEASFRKARKTHSLDTILTGLDRYIRDKPPDRSWLNPTTFLNQERFNDEPCLQLNGTDHSQIPAKMGFAGLAIELERQRK